MTDSQLEMESQQEMEVEEEPVEGVFVAPSVDIPQLLDGKSYTFHSEVPSSVPDSTIPCVLGVDEAGRGPVLGPMVYAVAYSPIAGANELLKSHYFDDSKKLTAKFRSELMEKICQKDHVLKDGLGWAVRVMSPQDISSGMMRAAGSGVYNLNAQAHDTTIQLIREVMEIKKINVTEIYVDTVGPPASYQAKLQKLFPSASVTVSKKADSIYPIVSAASVCAKVTRDACLEVSLPHTTTADGTKVHAPVGSGYPGDATTVTWLKSNKDPIFGWPGSIARFSWGTAKEFLENKSDCIKVGWAEEPDDGDQNITAFFGGGGEGAMAQWYGRNAGMDF